MGKDRLDCGWSPNDRDHGKCFNFTTYLPPLTGSSNGNSYPIQFIFMLLLSELERPLDLSGVIQDRVYQDLLDIHFTLFGTIQFNLKSLNTSLIERSFNLVKEVKQSIQNDFPEGMSILSDLPYVGLGTIIF